MINKIIITLVFSTVAMSAHALRCGNKIVQIGDHERDVIRKCGNPISHEEIGYIDSIESETRITVSKVEEYSFKIKGRLYYLTFEGNKLSKIEAAQK